jgi:hypothetical protein
MSELAYRYANAETFLKMLKSQTLWFSDLRRMNDWDEYMAGYLITSEIVAQEFPEYMGLLTEISAERMNSSFLVLICSFSMDGDCLSMWRGYGDNGSGASIGYKYDEIGNHHLFERYLKKMAPINGKVQFFPVIYQEDDFKENVRRYIRRTLQLLSGDAATKSPNSKAVQLGMLRVVLMRLFTLYKSDFFKDEREIRGFIEVNESVDAYALKVRKGDFGEMEYHEINTNFQGVSAIEEVVLGPRCAMPIAQVQEQLVDCGLSAVKVRQSRGTYREAAPVSPLSSFTLGA